MSERGVYRSIYSALIDNADYQGLSAKERLVLLTARICKQAGPAGIFRYYSTLLAEQTGLRVKDIEAALVGLERAGWIQREGPILWIRNALRYDPSMHLTNDKQRIAIENWLKELPRLPIVLSFCEHYKISEPFESSTDSHSNGTRYIGRRSTEDGGRKMEDGNPVTTLLSGRPLDLVHRQAQEILDFLNRKADRHFQSEVNIDFIRARLRGGATVDQCRAVIGRKVSAWKDDPKMAEYLRPKTLFNATNFAQYLGELPATAFLSNGAAQGAADGA